MIIFIVGSKSMQMTEMMVMIDNYGDGDDNNVEQG